MINGVFVQVCMTVNSVGLRTHPVIIFPFPRCIVWADILNNWQALASYLMEYGLLLCKASPRGLPQNLRSLHQTPREVGSKSHRQNTGGSPQVTMYSHKPNQVIPPISAANLETVSLKNKLAKPLIPGMSEFLCILLSASGRWACMKPLRATEQVTWGSSKSVTLMSKKCLPASSGALTSHSPRGPPRPCGFLGQSQGWTLGHTLSYSCSLPTAVQKTARLAPSAFCFFKDS